MTFLHLTTFKFISYIDANTLKNLPFLEEEDDVLDNSTQSPPSRHKCIQLAEEKECEKQEESNLQSLEEEEMLLEGKKKNTSTPCLVGYAYIPTHRHQ